MMQRKPNIQDFLDGTNLAHLAKLLRPWFAPSSYLLPPKASPSQVGNRVIAINTETQSQPKLQDSTILALVAGELTWSFKTKFTVPPSVTATPQGAGTGILNIDSVASNEVIVKSSNAGDTRLVHLQASESVGGQ